MNIKQLLDRMSLEEKVGQLFQVGFSGTDVTDGIKEMINSHYPGGIIYFRRNLESLQQAADLSNGLQQAAAAAGKGIPLIISTDQEGGTVTRLTGATHFPGNMALGATRQDDLALQAGRVVAGELSAVGINMNLAPVLDVNNNPANPVIGVRSYGEDPRLVVKMGTAYISGLQEAGVIACGKHFPGHGDTNTDSHLALPIIEHDRERLERVELYPFKKAIEKGIDSIMTAHVYFPTIEEKQGIPATLSRNVLTGLLREELGYQGLIVTDCMEMNAIVSTYGTVEGAVMTIEAGADMVLISHTLSKAKAAIKAVIKAVKDGRITEERINSSVIRILTLKEKRLGLTSAQIADPDRIDFRIGEQTAWSIAQQGVTLVRNNSGLLPLQKPDEGKVLLIDFEMGRVSLVEDQRKHDNPLIDYLRQAGVQVKHLTVNDEGIPLPAGEDYDLVVVCTYDAVKHPDQVKLIKELQQEERPLAVLALRNPYDLNLLPGVDTYLTTYDYSPYNLRAAAEVITGKIKPQGQLPVTVNGI